MGFWGYVQGLIVGALSLVGFAARGAGGLAARAAAAGGGLALARTRRSSRSRGRCCWAGCSPPASRCSAFTCATASGSGSACSTGIGGAVLVGCLGPRAGVDRRRGRAPDPRGARPARADPALGDPQGAQRRAAAVGPAAEGAGALRPVPHDRRPRSRACGAPDSAIARDPAGARRRAQRGEGARHRLRARRAGLGLGGGRRGGGDQRPRGRRPGRHDRAGAGRGPPPRRRRDLVRPEERPRDPARVRRAAARRRCR